MTGSSEAVNNEGGRVYKYNPPSLYVTDAFYDWLMDVSGDLATPEVRSTTLVDRDTWNGISELLSVEGRLLDQKAFNPWLGLYYDECAYWIASGSPAPDPRKVVTLPGSST
jgi:hypothetical protein